MKNEKQGEQFYELTKKAQAFYLDCRAKGLNHASALNAVCVMVWTEAFEAGVVQEHLEERGFDPESE